MLYVIYIDYGSVDSRGAEGEELAAAICCDMRIDYSWCDRVFDDGSTESTVYDGG